MTSWILWYYLGAIFLGGNCPGCNCPGGDDNCPGVIFRGGDCPRWQLFGGGQLSCSLYGGLPFGNVVRLQSLNRLKVFARESPGFFTTITVWD